MGKSFPEASPQQDICSSLRVSVLLAARHCTDPVSSTPNGQCTKILSDEFPLTTRCDESRTGLAGRKWGLVYLKNQIPIIYFMTGLFSWILAIGNPNSRSSIKLPIVYLFDGGERRQQRGRA